MATFLKLVLLKLEKQIAKEMISGRIHIHYPNHFLTNWLWQLVFSLIHIRHNKEIEDLSDTQGQLLNKHAQIAKAEQECRKASEELDDCHKRRSSISDEISSKTQILENCNVALESANEVRKKAAEYKQLSEQIIELEKDVLNHDNAKRNLAGYNADIQNCQNIINDAKSLPEEADHLEKCEEEIAALRAKRDEEISKKQDEICIIGYDAEKLDLLTVKASTLVKYENLKKDAEKKKLEIARLETEKDTNSKTIGQCEESLLELNIKAQKATDTL